MNFDNFKSIKDLTEIQRAFFHSKHDNPEVILWQNLLNREERIKKRSRFIQYVMDKGECWLKPKEGMFQFFSNHPLYFYIPKKRIIFKRFIYFNSPLKLIVKEPKEILLESKRVFERKAPGEKKYVNIKYGFDKNTSHETLLLKLRVINFNDGGLALKSSLNNIMKFEKGRPIKIESLYRRGEYLDGIVMHMTKTFDPQNSEYYFVLGIKFIVG